MGALSRRDDALHSALESPYAPLGGVTILRAPAGFVEVARIARSRRRPLMKDSSAASFRASTHRSLAGAAPAAFCAFAAAPPAAQPGRPGPFDLSLAELCTVRVQTASRRAETLNAVPSAGYVV